MNKLEFIIKASTPQGALGPVGFFPTEERYFDDEVGIVIRDEDSIIMKEGKHYKISIEEINPDEYATHKLRVSYKDCDNIFEKTFDYESIANNVHIDEISDSPILEDFVIDKISVIKYGKVSKKCQMN